MTTTPERLAQQLAFLREADRLKHIQRRNYTLDGSRLENSAEHSWHLGLMVLLLGEYAADPGLNLARAVQMALVHDLVEIDAGDTYAYDPNAMAGKVAREQAAAERLFNLLPQEQAAFLRSLWDEFEAGETPEAQFANAIDRLQPVIANHATQGKSWTSHHIRASQVEARCRPITTGAPTLGAYAQTLIQDALQHGFLRPD
jgi:putative hydrolase of HD superfamily